MTDEWPVYSVTVRSRVKTGQENHALRAWLKIGLRKFGLECIGIVANSSKKEADKMDMRNYVAKYIKPDNVRDTSIVSRIVRVFEDERYGRPTLELENGIEFSLNDGNLNALITALGIESDDWVEKQVELFLGYYKDWKAKPPVDKETVKIRALSPAATGNGPALPAPKSGGGGLRDDLNDDVPFGPEWR